MQSDDGAPTSSTSSSQEIVPSSAPWTLFNVGGYKVIKFIFENAKSRILLAERSGKNYVIKTLRNDMPDVVELDKLKHEYLVLKDLDIAGVVKAVSLEPHGSGLALVLEHFDGVTLREILRKRRMKLNELLPVAIGLARIIGDLHAKGVVHKDIKPDNILYNAETGELQVIDFGISSRAGVDLQSTRTRPKEHRQQELQGTAAYMSPEQTGRMNCLVDYRTDFYSLGVTLFELVTQRLPFYAKDVVEYIHYHLARPPPNPRDVIAEREGLDAELPPQPLCDVILKLLSKTVDERYNSANGILADLRFIHACLLSMQTGSRAVEHQLARFRAGEADQCSRLTLSKKLYDRDTEVNMLLDAYERVEFGGLVEVVMVRGYSGIGKSSIVNEMHRVLSQLSSDNPVGGQEQHQQGGGYFLSWKFDQLRKSTAGMALAFRDLIDQILSEGQEGIRTWASRIQDAVGANGQLLFDLLPNLERVIGPQPPVLETTTGPSEVQNRYNRTLMQFIRVFCGRPGPLVFFMDDLQWADVSSLKLLELITSEPNLRNLMLIGSYRDNEIDPTHPLSATLRELATRVHLIDIEVKPLDQNSVTTLVEDTLHCSDASAVELAQLLEEKTKGNPFYINQLLRSFHADGMLRFHFYDPYTMVFNRAESLHEDESTPSPEDEAHRHDTCSKELSAGGRWEWDLETLRRAADVTENVVDLMIMQIQRLGSRPQRILQIAAAIGDKFSLDQLAIITGEARPRVQRQLWKPLQAGFIVQLPHSAGTYLSAAGNSADGECSSPDDFGRYVQQTRGYRFLHDRVQQAAYSLIPVNERPSVHLNIGRRLLTKMRENEIDEHLFMVVNQINMGFDLIVLVDMQSKNRARGKDEWPVGVAPGDTTLVEAEKQSLLPELLQRNSHSTEPQIDRKQVALLDFAAGKKARAAMAYTAAAKYLDMAIALLDADDCTGIDNYNSGESCDSESETSHLSSTSTARRKSCWEGDRRAVTMEVFLEATIAHYLNTDFERAEQLCTAMLEHAAGVVEMVSIYEIQMQFHIQQHQMQSALDIGLSALKLLGVELEVERPVLDLTDEEYCEGLGEMKDEAMLAAMRILMNLCAPTYVLEPILNMRVAYTMVVLATKHGTSGLAAFGFGLYALTSFRFNLDEGYRAGSIGLRLMEKYHAKELTAKLYGLFYAHVAIWRNHMRDTLPHLEHSIHVGLETGDLEWAGYNSFYYCDHMLFSGEVLEVVLETQNAYLKALLGRHQELQATYLNIWKRMTLKLTEENVRETYTFGDQEITDADILSKLYRINNKMFLFAYNLAEGIRAYFNCRYEDALEHLRVADQYSPAAVGMMTNAQHTFYYSLALLATLTKPLGGINTDLQQQQQQQQEEMPPAERAEALAQIERNQQRLGDWAKHSPVNYQHKFALIEAQRMALRGKNSRAMDLFDEAIDQAQEGGFLHEEALARELAAEFYYRRKRNRVAADFLREAYYLFVRWGCVVKMRQLKERLPKSNTSNFHITSATVNSNSSTTTGSSSGSSSSSSFGAPYPTLVTISSFASPADTYANALLPSEDYLDIMAIIKSSQAILSEIEHHRLLVKLMNSMMEYTGANKSYLLLVQNDGKLLVEASAKVTNDTPPVLIQTDLKLPPKKAKLPNTVINFVEATREVIILEDMPKRGPFASDSYIKRHHPRSLLALPIMYLSELVGILYLENSASSSAFGKSRLWLISIISSQMGIALQNSILFKDLHSRTQDLQETNKRLEKELTKRKRIQVELENAMELAKAASMSKSQFLANMSHELRTPLNAIIGMTELLLESQLNDLQREWVELTQLSGRTLLELVDDILDLVKMERGKSQLAIEKLCLLDCLREVLAIYMHPAQAKQLCMQLDISSSCPEFIYTDRGRLRQVLLNLLSNAVKFTPQGGQIRVIVNSRRVSIIQPTPSDEHALDTSAPTVRDDENGCWDELHVCVTDSGPGVPSDLVEYLFQPFTQADPTFSRQHGGVGLGLALTRQIVELLGGRMWVEGRRSDESSSAEAPSTASFNTDLLDGASFHFVILSKRSAQSPELGSSSPTSPPATGPSSRYTFTSLSSYLSSARSSRSASSPPTTPSTTSALPAPGPSNLHVSTNSSEAISRATTARTFSPLVAAQDSSEFSLPSSSSTSENRRGTLDFTEQHSTEMDAQPGLPVQILVAEDNKTNQKLLIQLLRRLGYAADVANDGVEAVEAWHKTNYDIIFMDLQMPNMDGFAATRAIFEEFDEERINSKDLATPPREQDASSSSSPSPSSTDDTLPPESAAARHKPQIIAVTANVYESDREACAKAGMVDFLPKPLTKQALDRCLRNAIARMPARSTHDHY